MQRGSSSECGVVPGSGFARPVQSEREGGLPLRISWAVRPSRGAGRLCGDIATCRRLAGGRFGVTLVDAAGHGDGAAPLAALAVRALWDALCAGERPSAALCAADAALKRSGAELPYATAFAAVVDPRDRSVVYASAGHDLAFVWTPEGAAVALAPTAPMLGLPVATPVYDGIVRMRQPGAVLLVASDGVSQSRDPESGRFFGWSGAKAALREARTRGVDAASYVIRRAVAHARGRHDDDSASIVVYQAERPV